MKRRPKRVGSLIKAELSRILLEEVSDPRLKAVFITDVDLSSDLKRAHVYFQAHEDIKEALQGLKSARSFLKRRLGEEMELRSVPELEFEKDEHWETVSKVLAAIEANHA